MAVPFDQIPVDVWGALDWFLGKPGPAPDTAAVRASVACGLVYPMAVHWACLPRRQWVTDYGFLAHFWRSERSAARNPLADALGSPPTPVQQAIWRALDGRAMTETQLAKAASGGDGVRLYYVNWKAKSGGLKEMLDRKVVLNKPTVGYYRPDAPPRGGN
jgi:hypothetical protein